MNRKTSDLLDSLGLKELAIFCGAGISRNSGLPLANELKQYVLRKLSVGKRDMEEIMVSNLPFEAFMETISANTDILKIFEMFEEGEPDTNHILIARLAKHDYLKTIFTTNFDLLIEKALEKEGLERNKDFEVYYDEEQFSRIDFEHTENETIKIFKIHGSVDNRDSIRTTMKAVASRTLAEKRLNAMRYLFSTGNHKRILVLGYSCSDEFDITPQIQSVAENRKEIIFVEHCEEGTEMEDVKIKEQKNPFKAFPGRRIKCNTDRFIEDLWDSLRDTVGEYEPSESKVDWRIYADDWANQLKKKKGYFEYLIPGLLLTDVAKPSRALEYYEKSLHIAKAIGDKAEESASYANLGSSYGWLGDFERLIEYCEKALEIAKAIDHKRMKGRCFTNLGEGYRGLGNFNKAIECHKATLEIAQEIGDKQLESACHINLGDSYYRSGEFKKTKEYYTEALEMSKTIGDVKGEAICYIGLGNACYSLGDFERAMEYYNRGLEIAKTIGTRGEEADCHTNLGNVCFNLGDFNKALEYFSEALEIAKTIGDKEGQARCNLGLAYHALGNSKRAVECCKSSLEIARKIGAKADELRCLGGLGLIYNGLKDFQAASEYYKEALEIAERIGDKEAEAESYSKLGIAYYGLGDFEKAVEYLSKAERILGEIGQIHLLGEVYRDLTLAYEKIGENEKAEYYKRKLSTLHNR